MADNYTERGVPLIKPLGVNPVDPDDDCPLLNELNSCGELLKFVQKLDTMKKQFSVLRF